MHLFILDLHSIMFCFTVACELPLHLGDIVKSRRERGDARGDANAGERGREKGVLDPSYREPLTAVCGYPFAVRRSNIIRFRLVVD